MLAPGRIGGRARSRRCRSPPNRRLPGAAIARRPSACRAIHVRRDRMAMTTARSRPRPEAVTCRHDGSHGNRPGQPAPDGARELGAAGRPRGPSMRQSGRPWRFGIPDFTIAWLAGRPAGRESAIELLKDGFDDLEEDFGEEQFFAAARATYWKAADGSRRTRRSLRCSSRRSSSRRVDYKSSGVDIDAGNETVRRIRSLARSTFTAGVLSDIGSFGGLFRLEPGRFREPVLVASADGVGTKLKVAFMAAGMTRSASIW